MSNQTTKTCEQPAPAAVRSTALLADPCRQCRWWKLKGSGHYCERGASTVLASALGKCSKRNLPWPDDSANAEVSEVAVADQTKTCGVRPPLSLD